MWYDNQGPVLEFTPYPLMLCNVENRQFFSRTLENISVLNHAINLLPICKKVCNPFRPTQ